MRMRTGVAIALFSVLVPAALPVHAGGTTVGPRRSGGWHTIASGLGTPWALAIDPRGHGPNRWLYAVDASRNRVVKLGTAGRRLGGWSFAPRNPYGIPWYGIAVGGSGNVFVSDSVGNRVLKFSPQGRLLARWMPDAATGSLHSPGALAIDPRGNLYVADTENDRIVVFSPNGTVHASWSVAFSRTTGPGTPVVIPGQPIGLTLAPNGDVLALLNCAQSACTAEVGHADQQQAVVRYTSSGTETGEWVGGAPHSGVAAGEKPWIMAEGIASDRQGRWYVSGLLRNAPNYDDYEGVMQFSPSGKLLASWALPAGGGNPPGITVDPDSVVYVTQGTRVLKRT